MTCDLCGNTILLHLKKCNACHHTVCADCIDADSKMCFLCSSPVRVFSITDMTGGANNCFYAKVMYDVKDIKYIIKDVTRWLGSKNSDSLFFVKYNFETHMFHKEEVLNFLEGFK